MKVWAFLTVTLVTEARYVGIPVADGGYIEKDIAGWSEGLRNHADGTE